MKGLAPGLLVAAPPLADPNFDQSVVLLASHDEDGAFGWVINGPEVLTMGELLAQVGMSVPASLPHLNTLPVLQGGPVSTDQVWLVYPEQHRMDNLDGQMVVAPGVCACASRAFLERLSEGQDVPGLRAVAGYAGWAGQQVEQEVQSGAWLPVDVAVELIFRRDTARVWQDAYALQGTTPIAFISKTVGSA